MRSQDRSLFYVKRMQVRTSYTAKMKKLFGLIGFCAAIGTASAQQHPHYSQYMLNDYVMNPAIGGRNPYFEAKSDNRYQWIGVTDAPRTYILSVNGPDKSRKIGM